MLGPTKLCPEGIGLIFLDLDDTIVIDGGRISPRVLDAVALARERGCVVCASTGRPLVMVPPVLRRPDVMDYLICSNGARTYDTARGLLSDRPMRAEQVLAAMDALEPLRPGWNAFAGEEAYFEWRGLSYMLTGRSRRILAPVQGGGMARSRRVGGMARLVLKATGLARRAVVGRAGMHQVWSVRPAVRAAADGVSKAGCTLSSPEACERAITILAHLGCFELARMAPTEIEVTARGVTKGTAVTWLIERLGEMASRAVAFGDSSNDLPLADACGLLVAMGNADEELVERAGDVCETVYDDGVARWIERAMAEADGGSRA